MLPQWASKYLVVENNGVAVMAKAWLLYICTVYVYIIRSIVLKRVLQRRYGYIKCVAAYTLVYILYAIDFVCTT